MSSVDLEYGVRNGRTDQWFTFSDEAVARTVAREQGQTVHVRQVIRTDWIPAEEK